jgi:competence ComEA-like helix-hairpin-helix protein
MIEARIDQKDRAIVVGFGKNKLGDAGRVRVASGSLDDQTFQLFVEQRHHETNYDWLDYRRIAPLGIVPVQPVVNAAGVIVGGTRVGTALASGAAFLLSTGAFKAVCGGKLLVVLKGDFILDETGNRAVDAEFVGGELPTGDRSRGGNYGIQGSRFESWFLVDKKIDLNTATADELGFLPKVGPILAIKIVNYRTTAGGFGTVDDLLKVSGLNPDLLDQIKPFITVNK